MAPFQRITQKSVQHSSFMLLFLLNLVLRFFFASFPLERIDTLTLPDDTYISLTLARNIAQGLGPLYGDTFTNGFQPLYVFLISFLSRLGDFSPDLLVKLSLFVLAFFDVLTLGVIYLVVLRMTERVSIAFLTGLFWVFSPFAIATTLNGLETSIAVFFLACGYLIGYHLLSKKIVPLSRYVLFGVVIGLGIWARIDTLIFFAVLSAVILLGRTYQYKQFWSHTRNLMLSALIGLLVSAPWFVYSFLYTGDVYQISGKAVRFQSLAIVDHMPTLRNWYLPMLYRAGLSAVMPGLPLLAISFVLLCVLAWKRKSIFKRRNSPTVLLLASAIIYSAVMVLAYGLYIFTPGFFPRYMFPIFLTHLLLFAFVLDLFCTEFPAVPFRTLFLPVMGLLALLFVTNPVVKGFFESNPPQIYGYRKLGIWANENFAPGRRIGGSQTGALSYYATNHVVINLDGVVNKACYESLVRRQNLEYIREKEIEYIIGWDMNIDFLKKHSSGYLPGDLVFVEEIDEFTTCTLPWKVYRVKNSAGPEFPASLRPSKMK